MKRKILSVLSVLMAVLMSTAALSACSKTPAGADGSGGSGESVSTEQGGEPSVSESAAESSGESESSDEHAKELTAQIHGNAVWLEDSAAAYEANRDALWNTPIETNGAVIRCNSEEVFVYDAESGKLRYKAENYGETIRAEAYSARDGYDYRLLLLDSVVYRSTTDESKVLRETLPLDMKFEHCDAREFRDCYDINEQYFTWHDDDGIRLLSLDGGEPELILSNEDLDKNYKSILADHPESLVELFGEKRYGCPRFICGGTKIVATAFKESSICTGIVIYNISEGKIELGHFIYEPDEAQYPLADRYVMDDWYRIDAETDEIYKTAGALGDPHGWRTADGVTAVFYLYGLNGDGGQGEQRNLQLYFREIDHPQKYFRHVASIADPTTEATFDLISKDYLIINIGNDDLAVKYSE